MGRPLSVATMLLLPLLGGCGPSSVPDAAGVAPGERMEWQGLQPCADCAGIETLLVLEHDDGSRRYELTETYLTGDGGERFVETGDWQARDALVVLEGEDGVQRIYGLLADGRLQARDGETSSAAGGPLLLPVGGVSP